jgi:acyl-CoA thioesterase-1
MKKLLICSLLMLSFHASALPPVTVEMYGDSTTYGAELVNGQWVQSVNRTPVIVQNHWLTNVHVINKGVSGATLENLYAGTGAITTSWTNAMATSNADIVTLNFGINDANQGFTDAQINWYINTIVDIAQSYGKTVVIETPNPVNTSLYNRVNQVAQILRTAANYQQVTLVDNHLWIQSGYPNWIGSMCDGVHPNATLYAFKGENIYTMINGWVQWHFNN